MNSSPHEYSFQGQNQVSYSNQPSIPTEKQSFGVPQSVDQPYQSSRYIQPDQTIRKYKIVITPHNDLPSRYHSDHQKNQPYSYSSIPEEVSEYIFQDQSGSICLSADLNKILGLGKCLCILAILEILYFGMSAFICYMSMNMYGVVLSLAYMYMPVTFIQGYKKLDVNKGKCYLVIKRIINFVGIMIMVLVLAFFYFSQTQNDESNVLIFSCIVCTIFDV